MPHLSILVMNLPQRKREGIHLPSLTLDRSMVKMNKKNWSFSSTPLFLLSFTLARLCGPLSSQLREPGSDSRVEWKNLGVFSDTQYLYSPSSE